MEKKILMIFPRETFIFVLLFSLLTLFFPTFCVIAHLNQSGDGDMECFDQINSFHYKFSSSSTSNSNSCHGLNIGMTLYKSRSIYFGNAQISFEPSPLAHPCNMGTLWHFSSQKPTRLELLPSESK